MNAEGSALQDACLNAKVALKTFNGFPMGTFHGTRVKENVYRPDWSTQERLHYTCGLAQLGHACGATTFSISSLSGGFRPDDTPNKKVQYFEQWLTWVQWAHRFEDKTGTCVQLALEPEPFNTWQDQNDVISDWTQLLAMCPQRQISEAQLRRYLGVCFDTCHFSVRFIDLTTAYRELSEAGVPVHKIQVSVAPQADGTNQTAWDRFTRLAEPVYLHQTYHQREDGCIDAHLDLGELSKSMPREARAGLWRTHFHVPIHWSERADTTGPKLINFLKRLPKTDTPHLEVETYSFDALRELDKLNEGSLTQSIIKEIRWLQTQIAH
jgi:hypothetical protein